MNRVIMFQFSWQCNAAHECIPTFLYSSHSSSSSAAFSIFGVAHRIFNPHVLRYCASSIFICFSFKYSVFSYNITPPQFGSSYLSVSTHIHVLITILHLLQFPVLEHGRLHLGSCRASVLKILIKIAISHGPN